MIDTPSQREHQALTMESKVRLAHFSVKEYLESARILHGKAAAFHLESSKAHKVITHGCLAYLLCYSQGLKETPRDLASLPLLKYAAAAWYWHSKLHQEADLRLEVLFLSSEEALRAWTHLHRSDPKSSPLSTNQPYDPALPIAPGLYYAAGVELSNAVQALLHAGVDVNAKGGKYDTALQAAIQISGNTPVVKELLNAGADVNALGGYHGTALQAAALEAGNTQIIKMLLEAGAHVNAQGGYHGTALHAAALEPGNVPTVQLLLEADADGNAIAGYHGTALQAAALEPGNVQIIKLLLEAGANVNAQGGFYGTVLQAAAIISGNTEVFKLLLEAGTDVNAKGGYFGTALHAAVTLSNAEIVELLLQAGAEGQGHVSAPGTG